MIWRTGFTRHRRTCLFIIVIVAVIFAGVSIQVFSQREIYFRNGALHETTWRYNSTISQVKDDYLVSTFDKITGITTIQTFSLSKEKVVRTVVVNESLDKVVVSGEDGETLYEGTLTEWSTNSTRIADSQEKYRGAQ